MFTANQGDFSIEYYDKNSQSFRNYYPDFWLEMNDGSIKMIEIKADHMMEDETVRAKRESAEELAQENKMEYEIIPASSMLSKPSA